MTRVLWGVAVALGLLVAVGALLDNDVGGASTPTPVLVAKRAIPSGTPGTMVVGKGMYVPTTLPMTEVEESAIADPQFLTGRAAAVEILPGEQLTAVDFAATATKTIDSQIAGSRR